MRVELPDGQWCQLRDPKKVPERLRRPCEQVVFLMSTEMRIWMAQNEDLEVGDDLVAFVSKMPQFSREDVDLLSQMTDLAAVALIAEWSFDGVPVSLDALMDLPGDTYDAIKEAVQPLSGQMSVRPGQPTAADHEGSSATPTPPVNA